MAADIQNLSSVFKYVSCSNRSVCCNHMLMIGAASSFQVCDCKLPSCDGKNTFGS